MTAQFGDRLFTAGAESTLFANPLEQLFAAGGVARPPFDVQNSACWRGYVASWEVADDVLYLTGLDATVGGRPVAVADLFPTARVRADWVTDVLRVPRGECIGYVHMGYASTYAGDEFLSVWGGRVVLTEEFENPPAPGDDGRERFAPADRPPPVRRASRVTPQLDAVFGPDEAAFLRAVRADPAARTPRLVYADWLDDRNDTRATFIRHEETRPPGDPPPDWEDTRAELLEGVKHWLWMKLMGYPLPRGRWGEELIEW